jgi:hypothetical protein
MVLEHRLLHWMQRPIGRRKMLDRHHMAGIKARRKADAGIDRLVDQPISAEPPHQHGAGAAIALSAPFLGAAQALAEPQVIEQRLRRQHIGKRDLLVIEDEADGVADFGHGAIPNIGVSFPDRSNS